MGQTHFWNINDPAHKNYGVRNIVIDYSIDGVNWFEFGTHQLLQGSGLPDYEGLPGPDLDDIQARYIIITALDNWGGACYGMSELKIDVSSPSSEVTTLDADCLELSVFPNPAVFNSSLQILTYCEGDVTYTVRSVLGSEIVSENIGPVYGKVKIALPVNDMPPGIYSIIVNQGPFQVTKSLVVL